MNQKLVKNVKILVFAVPPPEKQDGVFRVAYGEPGWDPTDPFTTWGYDEDRKRYQVYFNKALKKKCEEVGYIFLDVTDKVTDEQGFLMKQYSLPGGVHITDSVFVTEFLKQALPDSGLL
jgi:hypothetical protein